MSDMVRCDNTDWIVDYLYDELSPADRRAADEHLQTCAACAAEVSGLAGARHQLASWAPPDAELGFTVVRAGGEPRNVLRPTRWWQPVVASPLSRAAAAVLVVAASLGLANLHVRYGADGVTVSTGWLTPVPAARAAAPAASVPVTVQQADWRPAFEALANDVRAQIRAARAELPVPAAVAARSPSDQGTLKRVASLIDESEQRQKRELALRLTQFSRDLEVQRRSDLVRINQGFQQFEGRSGAEIARQREMLNYIMRVSQPQQ
jgi:anti-sigma factor RsiW